MLRNVSHLSIADIVSKSKYELGWNATSIFLCEPFQSLESFEKRWLFQYSVEHCEKSHIIFLRHGKNLRTLNCREKLLLLQSHTHCLVRRLKANRRSMRAQNIVHRITILHEWAYCRAYCGRQISMNTSQSVNSDLNAAKFCSSTIIPSFLVSSKYEPFRSKLNLWQWVSYWCQTPFLAKQVTAQTSKSSASNRR